MLLSQRALQRPRPLSSRSECMPLKVCCGQSAMAAGRRRPAVVPGRAGGGSCGPERAAQPVCPAACEDACECELQE
jgi:hypothetical protein